MGKEQENLKPVSSSLRIYPEVNSEHLGTALLTNKLRYI